MVKEAIHPTSLAGIKRLAKQIKKASGVPHSAALNLAAQAGSFENFPHALQKLRANDNPAGHKLFLTIYWSERKPYRSGRETLEIALSRPLLEICAKESLRRERALGGFRVAASDHLVCDSLAQSQEYARSELCKAVRALRFIEATGLQPAAKRQKQKAMAPINERLPQKDHSTYWADVVTGHFVLLDEPYSNAEVTEERAAWAARNNWHLRASRWPGLYNPPACALFVASSAENDFDFEALMERINNMAPPVVSDEWDGISERGHETFVSPLALTPQDRRRARAKGTVYQVASTTTVPYSYRWNARRKPVGAMGISQHEEAGRIIKALLGSRFKPWAVNSRLETLRCTLEDWLNLEISSDELADGDFFDVYYHEVSDEDPFVATARSSEGVISLLGHLRIMLSRTYPDCAPLRRMTGAIDTSIQLTQRLLEKAVR